MHEDRYCHCSCSNRDCMFTFFSHFWKKDYSVCPKCKSECYVHWGQRNTTEFMEQFEEQEKIVAPEAQPGDGSRWEEI